MLVNHIPSRNELISWVNTQTHANLSNLLQLSDGIQFCQIFDKIYPNYIRLAKLIKDAKHPLQKEQNFRLLLNAMNNIGISMSINIMDLATGKITSILELLQWFYKEFKNPSIMLNRKEKHYERLQQPTLFRSYIEGIVPRQKSLFKNQKQEKSQVLRKSLDLRRVSQSEYSVISQQSQKSLSEMVLQNKRQNKNKIQNNLAKQQNSQNQNQLNKRQQNKQKQNTFNKKGQKYEISQINRNILAKSKQKKSKLKEMSQKKLQQESKKRCQIKKQQMRQLRQNKIKNRKQRSLQQCMQQAFNFSKRKMLNSLKMVTQEVIQTNPQLEQRIAKIINDKINQNQNKNTQKKDNNKNNQQNDIDYNFYARSANKSLIRQHDSIKNKQTFQLNKPNQNQIITQLPIQNQIIHQQSIKNQIIPQFPIKNQIQANQSQLIDFTDYQSFNKYINQKSIIKKDNDKQSSFMPLVQKTILQPVIPQSISNIYAQKDKNTFCYHENEKNQIEANDKSMRKLLNPEIQYTMGLEAKKESLINEGRKYPLSQNVGQKPTDYDAYAANQFTNFPQDPNRKN